MSFCGFADLAPTGLICNNGSVTVYQNSNCNL